VGGSYMVQSNPFKVKMNDINKKSLEKRVQEKLDAGYILHTPITSSHIDTKEYSYTEKRGYKYQGNREKGTYYAVVVKIC
jgi:hypothetical protein